MASRIPLVINSGAIQELQTGDTFNLGTGATLVSPVITGTGTAIFSQVNIVGQGDLRLEDTAGGEYVALQAPPVLASSYTLTLPVDDGTSGQALITDGSGNLSWSTAASGDVYGPASATSTAVALFDGNTGKLLKNSGVTVDGSNNVSGVAQLNATTVDLTNLEVTNIKAKDGTQAIAIADTTGALTLSSGTANGVAYLNGSKVLTTGSALTFDGTNLGVGTGTPNVKLTVSSATIDDATAALKIYRGGSVTNWSRIDNIAGALNLNQYDATTPIIRFQTSTDGSTFTEQMRLTSTGLGIGTSSPAAKLSVYQNTTSPIAFIGGDVSGTNGGLVVSFGNSASYPRVKAWVNGYQGVIDVFDSDNTNVIRLNARGDSYINGGNLGLGVTPSASGYKNFQINTTGIIGSNAGYVWFGNNWIYNSGDKYIANGAATLYGSNEGKHTWFTAPSGTAGAAMSLTQAMTLNASGNLGVGTSSPSVRLEISGTGTGSQIKGTGANGFTQIGDGTINASRSDGFYLIQQANAPTIFWTNNTERMRIDSSGNLLVAKTADTNSVAGTVIGLVDAGGAGKHGKIKLTNTVGTGQYVLECFNSSGTSVGGIVTSSSATTFSTSSDYRLKENIQPMQNALSVVQQLNPVTYTWKADGSDGQGFIAHELQAVVPDCVTGEKDAVDKDGKPVYQGIDTSFLVATLTKALQELKAELDATKAEVAALKAVN